MPRAVRVGDFNVDINRVLGEGAFGRVYMASHGVSADMAAAKQMRAAVVEGDDLAVSTREEIEEEARIMQLVSNHPSILSLVGTAKVDAHEEARFAHSYFVFTELCTGGELLDRVVDGATLPEHAVRPYAAGLFDALAHCHGLGVSHRDVKLDNILLSAEQPGLIKLADFGLAMQLQPGQLVTDTNGTAGYRSPEMHAQAATGFVGPPCDCWAAAICILALAGGGFPWEEAWAEDPAFAHVLAGQQQVPPRGSCQLVTEHYAPGTACPFSTELQDLLDALLRADPAIRVTMAQCLQHPWTTAAGRPAGGDAGGVYRDLDDDDDDDVKGPPPMKGLKKLAKKKAVKEAPKKK